VAGREVAGRAAVVDRGVVEVEARFDLQAGQLRDSRRVVGHGRGVDGAGGEGSGLADGTGAVLEQPEARGRGEARSGQGYEQTQQDDAAWVSHALSPCLKWEAVDPDPGLTPPPGSQARADGRPR